jgi:hypothetical protein
MLPDYVLQSLAYGLGAFALVFGVGWACTEGKAALKRMAKRLGDQQKPDHRA